MAAGESKVIPVKVAVRIRPLISRETKEGSSCFLNKVDGKPQVFIRGSNEAFTYDHVFDQSHDQESVFKSAVSDLLTNIHEGFNITILAYGQTGSGKTYTMGTSETGDPLGSREGVIQRSVRQLFQNLVERSTEFDYSVQVSFLELYKEKLLDLLNLNRGLDDVVDIREDPKLGIRVVGAKEISVSSWEEALSNLAAGALNRKTGATAMNDVSSRSHAIFTLHIQLTHKKSSISKFAKFHLVDLAGSERASKTQAVGERFAEGVNINKGLLALGNVISALCEGNSNRHIPYRDSKLTRLLQDSLGGNSHTLMVACVSPADSNYEETLSTLRYADRARKIKNKPIVNIDPNAELIALRSRVKQLEQQLLASQAVGGVSSYEVEELRLQLKVCEEKNDMLTQALQAASEENTNLNERVILMENARQEFKEKLDELQDHAEHTVHELNSTFVIADDRSFDGAALEKIRSLASKISNVQQVQLESDKELYDHVFSQKPNSEAGAEDSNEKMDDAQDNEDPEAVKSRHTKIGADLALRQAALSDHLKDINTQLMLKAQMVQAMTSQQEPLAKAKAQYESAVNELEKQISALQREKEELASALQSAAASQNACKVSEQRRKRLQELESLIADLKKKIQEQSNIIKIKERAEEQLKRINVEIQSLKSNRVKLIRQIREENEKFRKWQIQKERELTRLKAQDRKREGQLKMMEQLHHKQQHVMRRKMEEAVAANKRLKEALSLQGAKKHKGPSGASVMENEARIASWLDNELELVVSTRAAEQALEELTTGRSALTSKKDKLQSKLSHLDKNTPHYKALENEIANLEADIDQRSEQIVDLKQKISDADVEGKSKSRWDYIQVMIEAKIAMRHLFEACAEAQGAAAAKQLALAESQGELADLLKQFEEAERCLARAEAQLEETRLAHESEVNKLSHQYESKIVTLLKQLPPCGLKNSADHKIDSDQLLERLKLQEEEITRCAALREELTAAREEIERLKEQVAGSSKENSFQRPKKRKERLPTLRFAVEELSPGFASETDSARDDPDWRMTPVFRRIKKLKEENQAAALQDHTNHEIDGNKRKKSGGRSYCVCKSGKCRSCVCAKANRACGAECGCSSVQCTNPVGVLGDENSGVYPIESDSARSSMDNSADNNSGRQMPAEENLPPAKKRSRDRPHKRSFFPSVEDN